MLQTLLVGSLKKETLFGKTNNIDQEVKIIINQTLQNYEFFDQKQAKNFLA